MHDLCLARSLDRTARIPALTVTSTGRVILAWDDRPDWRDLPGDISLRCCHSDDGGLTWSAPRSLREAETGQGYGDASLLTDPVTGTVWCFSVGSAGASYFTAEPAPSAFALELWLARSDDDGITWSHRRIDGLRPDGVSGMFAASGNGAALDDGTLLQPFVARRGDETFTAVARSTDHGDTWELSDLIGPDCDESKVVGLAQNRVLLHARSAPLRRSCASLDGGVSFPPPLPHPQLIEPACNGGLCRLGDVLVCSLLDDPKERRRLVLRMSHDEGETWSEPLLVNAGACGYSAIAALPDRHLGIVWEEGDYASLRWARISPAELGLTGSAPTLVPRESAGAAAKPPLTG